MSHAACVCLFVNLATLLKEHSDSDLAQPT